MPNVMAALPNIGGALYGSSVEVWQTSDLRPLRLGEEKKEEEDRRKETTGQKYNGPPIT